MEGELLPHPTKLVVAISGTILLTVCLLFYSIFCLWKIHKKFTLSADLMLTLSTLCISLSLATLIGNTSLDMMHTFLRYQ